MKKIGGIDIRSLVEEYGSPLYVYDEEKLAGNYTKISTAFKKHYPKTDIHYSVKSNSNLYILKLFRAMGCGVDCSSPMEYHYSRLAGFESAKVLYTGNYESNEDLAFVADQKLKLNLDDINSFRRIQKIHVPELISFRINPGIGKGGFEGITTGGTDAKFGIPYEKAYDAYKLAKDAGVKRFGIHMMTGSNNLEPYFFAEIVDKLMMISADIFGRLGIIPEYVDIGGGFGVPYTDEDGELDMELTAKLVTEVFRERSQKYGYGEPALVLEPGRYLSANAGYLLSTVTGIKDGYKKYVGLDAGMNTLLRPALYGAFHRMEVYGKKEKMETVNICGQICENSDIFVKNISFPSVGEGDIVIIRDAGAYSFVMASNYNNRPKPAEVAVNGSSSKLIRRRETVEDLLNTYPEYIL